MSTLQFNEKKPRASKGEAKGPILTSDNTINCECYKRMLGIDLNTNATRENIEEGYKGVQFILSKDKEQNMEIKEKIARYILHCKTSLINIVEGQTYSTNDKHDCSAMTQARCLLTRMGRNYIKERDRNKMKIDDISRSEMAQKLEEFERSCYESTNKENDQTNKGVKRKSEKEDNKVNKRDKNVTNKSEIKGRAYWKRNISRIIKHEPRKNKVLFHVEWEEREGLIVTEEVHTVMESRTKLKEYLNKIGTKARNNILEKHPETNECYLN